MVCSPGDGRADVTETERIERISGAALAHERRAAILGRADTSTAERNDIINAKVFVGNVSFETTQGQLQELFSQVGPVEEVFVPVDRATGRPRGFAFVRFTGADAASEAIEKFDGHELNGRNLRVTEAEERAPRPRYDSSDGPPSHQKRSRPKGSRRNLRGKKRSL